MKDKPKRIGMWSGPRNISTALMRSFENRSDTTVIDEPFYAYFLNETGIKHPIYKEVIKNYDTSWDRLGEIHNCFLIRNPKQVIISYLKIHNDITPELIGLPQQLHIFNAVVKKTNKIPIVISSEDILENPKLMLSRLCDLLDIPFSDQMLQWAKGKRESDGIWGKYWYKNVVQTISFNKPKNRNEKFPDRFLNLLKECMYYYKEMEQYKISNE